MTGVLEEMKEIAKKYPKGWHQFLVDGYDGNRSPLFAAKRAHDLSFYQHLGYLVLEFFPSHGIEIERYLVGDDLYYGVKGPALRDRRYGSHKGIKTPEAAIEKAFEILEEILEEK